MASSTRHTPDTTQWSPTPTDWDDSGQNDSGQRGTLTIGDKVAQRLAVHAAISTPGVERHAAGLDKLTGRDLPAAKVDIASNRAAAHLTVAITWPQPLAEVASAVQRNVTHALHVMAGLQVDRVDVEVTHLTIDTEPARRVR